MLGVLALIQHLLMTSPFLHLTNRHSLSPVIILGEGPHFHLIQSESVLSEILWSLYENVTFSDQCN